MSRTWPIDDGRLPGRCELCLCTLWYRFLQALRSIHKKPLRPLRFFASPLPDQKIAASGFAYPVSWPLSPCLA
jgi:hypothetical protein